MLMENVCFVCLEKAFDRIPRELLEQAIGKNKIPDILIRSVMSLYEDAKI